MRTDLVKEEIWVKENFGIFFQEFHKIIIMPQKNHTTHKLV
jgi:hypothetical protein